MSASESIVPRVHLHPFYMPVYCGRPAVPGSLRCAEHLSRPLPTAITETLWDECNRRHTGGAA